jgi:hypothetical protein
MTMTHYDRSDIVDAHYWFCVDYHTGQWSQLYARQCRISRYFKPSILARGPATENAQAIYDNLVKQGKP